MLAAIAYDRYYVIVHPLNIAARTSKKKVRLFIYMIWSYALVLSSMPFFEFRYGRYVPDGFLTSCNIDYLSDDIQVKVFTVILFVIEWCCPIIIIFYCYAQILIIVCTNNVASSSRYGQEDAKKKTDTQLGILIFKLIILCLSSWTPHTIMILLGVFNYKEYITPQFTMISAILCKSASSINPVIYGITHPRIKIELTKLLQNKKKKKLIKQIGLHEELDQKCNSINNLNVLKIPSNENVKDNKKIIITTCYIEHIHPKDSEQEDFKDKLNPIT